VLTSCRVFPRAFNESTHKDELELAVRLQQVDLLRLPHPQPPATPQHQQRALTLVTNPSTFSKQPHKLAVAVAQGEALVEAVELPEEGQTLQALALALEQQLEQAQRVVPVLAISTSCGTTHNSSSYVKSSRLSRVCSSPFSSKLEQATHSWRARLARIQINSYNC